MTLIMLHLGVQYSVSKKELAGSEDHEKSRDEADHVTNSRQNRSGDFTASHLPPFPAQASLSGNLYHQPIALPHAFSRRDSTVSGACFEVESRRSLGETA